MKRLSFLALAIAFLALGLTFSGWQNSSVAAADENDGDCQTVNIYSDDIETSQNATSGGEFFLDMVAGGTGMIVNSGSGTGSLQLSTPGALDKVDLKTYDYAGRLLSQLTSLSYTANRLAGTASQDAAVKIEVFTNAITPGGFTTLVFEPVYNPLQGAVTNNTQQTFDAVRGGNAIFYSTHDLRDASGNLVACQPGGAFALANPTLCANKYYISLSTIQAAFPNATITSIALGQGSGNAGLTTLVDNFNVGFNHTCLTYNFERLSTGEGQNPNVQACKNGGFATQTDPRTGGYFRNQGQCVSYFAQQGNGSPTPTPTASPSPTTSPSPSTSPSPTPSVSPSPVNRGAVCMNGGWRTLLDNNHRAFRNEGQCVSFYNSRGRGDDNDDEDDD